MPPVPYDICVLNNVKVVVSAFNQEKALVGAFSLIVQLCRWIVRSSNHFTAQDQEGEAAPGGASHDPRTLTLPHLRVNR